MRAIWKGSISFGLINIPIALYPATREEEIKFRLLRAGDLSPINYKRVAEADGKEVPWDHVVKGFEYDKDRFVVLTDEDFQKVELESTQTVDITDFVPLEDINPMHFHRPYYIEPQKGGQRAYALLRDALKESCKVGVAKVVIKTRQHLAALKPFGKSLILELMHFADELIDPAAIHAPGEIEAHQGEREMARELVATMSSKWEPDHYLDEYKSALMKLIEAKVQKGEAGLPRPRKPRPATNVVDLTEVLRKSISEAQHGRHHGKGEDAKHKKAA